jgi:hypothetical protein
MKNKTSIVRGLFPFQPSLTVARGFVSGVATCLHFQTLDAPLGALVIVSEMCIERCVTDGCDKWICSSIPQLWNFPYYKLRWGGGGELEWPKEEP